MLDGEGRDRAVTDGTRVANPSRMEQPEPTTDWRREVDRLRHEYNDANLGRSVRDCVWYGGQVAVMLLSYKQRHLGVYSVLAAIALFVSVATGIESFKWRRELKRDKAEGRA